jgi:hypothetical protein
MRRLSQERKKCEDAEWRVNEIFCKSDRLSWPGTQTTGTISVTVKGSHFPRQGGSQDPYLFDNKFVEKCLLSDIGRLWRLSVRAEGTASRHPCIAEESHAILA